MSRARSVADLGNQNVLDLNASEGTLKVGAGATIENTGEVQFAGIVTAATVQIGAATTLHSTGLDLGSGNITSHNITSTGNLSVDGNIDVGGVLTYEDVTSVDSVGVITARDGIHVTGGSVGIGTTNPGSKLTVEDNGASGTTNVFIYNKGGDSSLYLLNDDQTSAAAGTLVDNGSYIELSGKYSSANTVANRTFGRIGAFKENNTSTDQSGYLALYSRPSSGGLEERLHITSGGNVGINESNPGAKLHIVDTVQATANGHSQVLIIGDDSGTDGESSAIFMSAINATNRGIKILSERQSSNNNHDLIFQTSPDGAVPTEKLRITSGGNVGIGTDDPQVLLQLGSRTSATPSGTLDVVRGEVLSGGTGPLIRLIHGPDGGTQRTHSIYSYIGDLRINADSNQNMEFHTGGSESMSIRSDGKIYIGPHKTAGEYGTVSQNVPYKIGVSPYGWANGGDIAEISMGAHNGTGQDDGQIVFKTATNVHSSATGLVDRVRIEAEGQTRFYGDSIIYAPDAFYTQTHEITSSWTSYQTIASGLSGNTIYLVSINWSHGSPANQPYYYATSFLFHTANGTNGSGAENEKTFLHTTHTGSPTSYFMTFRGLATSGGSSTGHRLQAKINTTWPGATTGNNLKLSLTKVMDGTRSF